MRLVAGGAPTHGLGRARGGVRTGCDATRRGGMGCGGLGSDEMDWFGMGVGIGMGRGADGAVGSHANAKTGRRGTRPSLPPLGTRSADWCDSAALSGVPVRGRGVPRAHAFENFSQLLVELDREIEYRCVRRMCSCGRACAACMRACMRVCSRASWLTLVFVRAVSYSDPHPICTAECVLRVA